MKSALRISISLFLLLARICGTSCAFVRVDQVFKHGDTRCTTRPLHVFLSPYPFNTASKNFQCVDYQMQKPFLSDSSEMEHAFYGRSHYSPGLSASLPPLVPNVSYLITYSHDLESCSGPPLGVRAVIADDKCIQKSLNSYCRVRCSRAKQCSIIYYSDPNCKELDFDEIVEMGSCSGTNMYRIVKTDKDGNVRFNAEFSSNDRIDETVVISNGVQIYQRREFLAGRDVSNAAHDEFKNSTFQRSSTQKKVQLESEQELYMQLESGIDDKTRGYSVSYFTGFDCPLGLTFSITSFAHGKDQIVEGYRAESVSESGELVMFRDDVEYYRGKLCRCINLPHGHSVILKSVGTNNECQLP